LGRADHRQRTPTHRAAPRHHPGHAASGRTSGGKTDTP
jgi:hypothetical protein